MFCPKCGKVLASEGLKYCSSCGLPLSGVKEIVAEEIGSATPNEPEPQSEPDSARLKGFRKGIKSLLIGIGLGVVGYLLVLAKLILDGRIPPNDIIRELLIPLGYIGVACLILLGPIFFLFGIVRVFYALAIEKGALLERRSPSPEAKTTKVHPAPGREALPAEKSIPLDVWQQSGRTSEIVTPQSVTDRTTKLLHDQNNEEENR